MNPYKREYTLLGIAAAGVYARVGPNTSVTIYDRRLSPYLGDLAEGGVVVDKRPCVNHPDFYQLVCNGPLLKESLPAGTKEELVMEEKGFLIKDRIAVPIKEGGKLSGFDYIALDVYLANWEKLGCKIGHRHGDKIVWKDGSETIIPPAEQRWQSTIVD